MMRRMVVGARIALSALVFAVSIGCTQTPDAVSAPVETPVPVTKTPAPDPAAVAANELGRVPVLMYHQLSASPVGEYDQTPDEFRAELDRLYRANYRPVTAADYISGRIDLPAGTHPVVLTFDDSTLSQIRFLDDGVLDDGVLDDGVLDDGVLDDGVVAPDTAIGIMEEFGVHHPDFEPTATFYVNNEPFGADNRALAWLAAHGYEIGAHTATHANLARLDGVGVQREFVQNVRAIESAVPNRPVRTMALPLGISPADRALATGGSWDGTNYRFDAVMLVGAEPAPSPFGQVDPAAIPRIRSGRGEVPFDSAYWLTWLDENTDQRYTSDGDPERVSFPAHLATELGTRWADRANSY